MNSSLLSSSSPNSHISNVSESSETPRMSSRRRKKSSRFKISSLDFDPIVNDYSIRAIQDRFYEKIKDDDVHHHQDRNSHLVSENLSCYGATFSMNNSVNTAFETTNSVSEEKEDEHTPAENGSYEIPLLPKPSSIKWKRRKKPFLGYSGKTLMRWILTIITGLCTGLVAVFIMKMSQAIVNFRLIRLNRLQTQMHQDLKQMEYNDRMKDDDLFFGSLHDDNDDNTDDFGILTLSPILFLSWSYLKIFFEYLAFNLVLAVSSAALCLISAPDAVGSGIPEIKAHLNGVRVSSFSKMNLFLVKIFGTILSSSSGLMIGPEGPLVHLGAIIGSSLTKTKHLELWDYRMKSQHPNLSKILGCGSLEEWKKKRADVDDEAIGDDYCDTGESNSDCTNSSISTLIEYSSHFRNDCERRDLISIGAAAGFAAAFGAPIGGVLFSLEEASTFFAHEMLWRTMTATAVATFCIAASNGDISQYGIISLGNAGLDDSAYYHNLLRDHFIDLPLYMLVGAIGGLLGAVFNVCYKHLNHRRIKIYVKSMNIRKMQRNFKWKLCEVAFVSILTSLVTFIVPLSFDFVCEKIQSDSDIFRFNCQGKELNQMAYILFGSRDEAIKDIISDPNSFDPKTLLIVGILAFPIMILTFGISLPSGIFMPTILIGASFGGYGGLMLKKFYNPHVSTTIFSLLGAAAMLAGIQRSTVSLCVILMEGTGQTKVLIPVVVTVVVARFVGDLFTHGLYEIGMELKNFPYLEHHVKREYDIHKVSGIMSTPPVTVNTIESAKSIEILLRNSPHHAFPVIDLTSSNKRFVGLVRRDQLVALIECRYFMENAYQKKIRRRPSMMRDVLHTPDTTVSGNDLKLLENEGINSSNQWIADNVQVTMDHVILDSDDTLPRVVIPVSQRMLQTVVQTDCNGNLVVKVAEDDEQKNINIAAVMNRGAKCVTEQCPISVAYRMFTTLGLRHLCVLGGVTGGEIVGILTRENMRDEYIEKRFSMFQQH